MRRKPEMLTVSAKGGGNVFYMLIGKPSTHIHCDGQLPPSTKASEPLLMRSHLRRNDHILHPRVSPYSSIHPLHRNGTKEKRIHPRPDVTSERKRYSRRKTSKTRVLSIFLFRVGTLYPTPVAILPHPTLFWTKPQDKRMSLNS